MPDCLSEYRSDRMSDGSPYRMSECLHIYIYIHTMGAKFSDTSCFWVIGHFENCVLAVVICNLLSIVICLDLMFDGRFFLCVRLS